MNNIQFIHDKYFQIDHISPKDPNQNQHWIGISPNLILDDISKYLTICLLDTPNYEVLNLIYEHMMDYGHLFLKESCYEIVKQLFDSIETHKEEDKKRSGVSVVHIIEEGFIIVPLAVSEYKYWREYTLEEYEASKQQYVVCGIARNEKDYVKDWVAYHLHIGFDKVYLYDNNLPNGEKYDELLKEFVESGQLEIIDVRGKVGFQIGAYYSFYNTIPFKYVAIIDIDEFIWLKETSKYTHIKQFINEAVEDKTQYGIMLQWRCYKGTGIHTDTSKPIWEIDNEPIDYTMRRNGRCELVNGWIKSIYKAGYYLGFNEHFGWYQGNDNYTLVIDMVNWTGKKVWKTFCDFNINEQDKAEVFVKHFIFRNVKNIYYNKYMRGHAGWAASPLGVDGWNYRLWLHNINYYTDLLPYIEPEEQLFLRSKGMKPNYTFHPDATIINNVLRGNTNINSIVNEMCENVQDWANVQYSEIDCDQIGNFEQPDYREEIGCRNWLYSFDFNKYSMYSTYYCGHYIYDESWLIENKYQEQIILSIGFPIEYMFRVIDKEEQQKYVDSVREFLCYNNIRNMFRQVIENPNAFFVHNQFVKPVGDAYGWKENLEEFLHEHNSELPEYQLINNTFCTSLTNYRKIKDFQKIFTKQYGELGNEWIVEQYQKGLASPYHALICSMLSPIQNITTLYFSNK